MSRSVEEWVGKDDDAVPPPRVRIRVFDNTNGTCYLCKRKIFPGEYWQADHIIALCNGGGNCESNLSPACRNCCYTKTSEDVAQKSKLATLRKKHLGISKPKKPLSPWKRKMNGKVVRRDAD